MIIGYINVSDKFSWQRGMIQIYNGNRHPGWNSFTKEWAEKYNGYKRKQEHCKEVEPVACHSMNFTFCNLVNWIDDRFHQFFGWFNGSKDNPAFEGVMEDLGSYWINLSKSSRIRVNLPCFSFLLVMKMKPDFPPALLSYRKLKKRNVSRLKKAYSADCKGVRMLMPGRRPVILLSGFALTSKVFTSNPSLVFVALNVA